MIRIAVSSVFVDDQERALRFYTDVLGFVTKHDIPVGDHRWLTVVSPAGPDGLERLLEPNDNPAAKTFQASIREQGIPATTFAVDDLRAEHARMTELGVAFTVEPVAVEGSALAVFDDTCGNLISLHQVLT